MDHVDFPPASWVKSSVWVSEPGVWVTHCSGLNGLIGLTMFDLLTRSMGITMSGDPSNLESHPIIWAHHQAHLANLQGTATLGCLREWNQSSNPRSPRIEHRKSLDVFELSNHLSNIKHHPFLPDLEGDWNMGYLRDHQNWFGVSLMNRGWEIAWIHGITSNKKAASPLVFTLKSKR